MMMVVGGESFGFIDVNMVVLDDHDGLHGVSNVDKSCCFSLFFLLLYVFLPLMRTLLHVFYDIYICRGVFVVNGR